MQIAHFAKSFIDLNTLNTNTDEFLFFRRHAYTNENEYDYLALNTLNDTRSSLTRKKKKTVWIT